MFSELPKLFDRNFAMGFFLPVSIFISSSTFIISQFAFNNIVDTLRNNNLIIETTIIGLLSWLGGIILLAINRDLYRFIEGYGAYNPLKLLLWLEKRRYRRIIDKVNILDIEYQNCISAKLEFPHESRIQRNKLMRQLAEEFPDKEEFLLPTPFGNVLRSFEVYPRVMYGIDSIDAWGRLLAVIPKDFRDLIETAKSQVDFWFNLGLVFCLLLIEYGVLAMATSNSLNFWIFLLFIILCVFAHVRATSAAKEWGDFVKSAFDVHRFKLLEALCIKRPKSRDEEETIWRSYSQAIIYRLPDIMPEITSDQEI